jgi:hypothetical protein
MLLPEPIVALVPVAPFDPFMPAPTPDAPLFIVPSDMPDVPDVPDVPCDVVDFDFFMLFFAFGVDDVGVLASFIVLSEAVGLMFSWPAAWAPPAKAMAIDAATRPLSKLLVRMVFLLGILERTQEAIELD